jgi:hypothetical protein
VTDVVLADCQHAGISLIAGRIVRYGTRLVTTGSPWKKTIM